MAKKSKGKNPPLKSQSPYDPSNKLKPVRNDVERRKREEEEARERRLHKMASVSTAMSKKHQMDEEEMKRMLDEMMNYWMNEPIKMPEPPSPKLRPYQQQMMGRILRTGKQEPTFFYMGKNGIMSTTIEPEYEPPLIGGSCPERNVRRLEGDLIEEFEDTHEIQLRVFVPQQYAYRHRPDTRCVIIVNEADIEDLYDGTYLINERALAAYGI